jgi:hypothetical protein
MPIIPKAGTDFFGAWLVDLVYGGLDTRGWRICYVGQDKGSCDKTKKGRLPNGKSSHCDLVIGGRGGRALSRISAN